MRKILFLLISYFAVTQSAFGRLVTTPRDNLEAAPKEELKTGT